MPSSAASALHMAIGISRDDGSYTRLLRADELEELMPLRSFRSRGFDHSASNPAALPVPVYETETQLGLAYGYGTDSYTRLLCADELSGSAPNIDEMPSSANCHPTFGALKPLHSRLAI